MATPALTQISLAWNSSVAATNYDLKRATASGGPYAMVASLTGTSYTDAGVSNGPVYYYVVTAVDQFGESSNSTPAAATLVNLGYQLAVVPLAQTILAGTGTNYAFTVTTNSAFGGSLAFGVTGLPNGAQASFNPPSLNASGVSTFTVQTATNTLGGSYPLTISVTTTNFTFTTNVTLSVNGVAANPGTLLWTGGGTGANWSTTFDWTNLTAAGYGPPGSANNLLFTNAAAVSSPATANNVVDGNYTVAALQYANNAVNTAPNYSVALINSGQTLVVTNGLIVGTATDAGASQVVNAVVTGANGTLTLSNGVLAVTQGSGTDGAHQAVLDLSGLGALNLFNVSKLGVAVYQFPAQAGNGGQRSSGILYLARTNYIALTSIGVTNGILVGWNDSQGNGSSAGVPISADDGSALYLGQTNSICTDAIYVGTDKTLGCLLAFNPNGLSSPAAYIRGLGGAASRVSLWGIGDTSMKSGSNQSASGTNDFTGGTVDALVASLTVGVSQTSSSSGNTGNGTGVLTFNAGTLDVNYLTNGWSVGTGTNGTDSGTGTLNVNDAAILRVNHVLALGQNTGAGTGVPAGTLNLNNGTVLATNILGGSGISTLNLNSGTLDLQSTNPVPGQISNVTTLVIGANDEENPALLANAAAISSASAIVIGPNGTLAGNTIITSPGLIVNGTLSPGKDGVGAMTNNGPVTLGAGGEYVVTVQDAAAGPDAGWSFLQVSKGIDVQASAGNPFTIGGQTIGGPAANFNYRTNFDWVIATANHGVTNFDAGDFTVDDSLFQNDLAGGYFYVRAGGNSLVLSFTNNHPPVAAADVIYRTGDTMTIPLASLTNRWSDPDGDPVVLNGVGASSSDGTNNVSTDGVYIYYTNASPAADTIAYTVQDVRTNPPAVYRAGDTLQTAMGVISILPPPAIGGVTWDGGSLVFSGGGGAPGGIFLLLSSTNLALPPNLWTVTATNAFDGGGHFNFASPAAANVSQQFYRLEYP